MYAKRRSVLSRSKMHSQIILVASVMIWILGCSPIIQTSTITATAFVVTPSTTTITSSRTRTKATSTTTSVTAQPWFHPNSVLHNNNMPKRNSQTTRLSAMAKNNDSSKASSSPAAKGNGGGPRADAAAELEYQELKSILTAMQVQNIPSRSLTVETRSAVESLLRTVLAKRPTTIPLRSIHTVLPGTTWNLGFSTETATLGDLPKDAQVKLCFYDDDDNDRNKDGTTNDSPQGRSRRVDYCLEFSEKTFGMKRLVAQSSYTVDMSPVNPGLVTFVYDNIVTDIFGFQNVGVGFFGLLKGRANYIESVFMDTCLWIERGYTPEGKEFYNVYVRDNGLLEMTGTSSPSVSSSSATKTVTTATTTTPSSAGAMNLPPIIRSDDQWD